MDPGNPRPGGERPSQGSPQHVQEPGVRVRRLVPALPVTLDLAEGGQEPEKGSYGGVGSWQEALGRNVH